MVEVGKAELDGRTVAEYIDDLPADCEVELTPAEVAEYILDGDVDTGNLTAGELADLIGNAMVEFGDGD